ncbi:PseG/SpsG family protein [Planomonospora sp. ID82291]|uniref:PseG/SpsG family protein n=1 Tax=Planomonospora sp. ID82291 TaxID=2738136 RepID=UPI0018C3ACA7|nr:hypothetical protein [Planomonospora sp. ID82291]MBG0813534.1 spore coat protein [Planomonospora sp. ID82291]
MSPRIGIRCDAGPLIGVGHLVRCVALAEELAGRGVQVVFLGDLGGLPWAAGQLVSRGLPLVPAAPEPRALAGQARDLALDGVVLDSYTLDPGTGAALRESGLRVLAVVDGDLRGQSADLYLDQNLGAEERDVPVPEGSVRLAGAGYVLLRDAVRRLRARPGEGPARVLCFFGGTDAAGVAPRWAEALAGTGAPFTATVVSARPIPSRPQITVIPPTDALPALMAGADLVITATGTSTWELLHLGVPAGLTWVAENQLIGYDEVVGRGLAAGLGPGTAAEEAVPLLRDLLTDPLLRRRYGERGRALVDGRGRARVADALLGAIRSDPRSAGCPSGRPG